MANLPDYATDPNAVLRDTEARWRYGGPPDYSKAREHYAKERSRNHKAGSLEEIVENLVKNWEIEASHKMCLDDWRTVDPAVYSMSLNGSAPEGAERMLKVGTYNALIPPNEYYDPARNDFTASHKLFKRMIPVFAWEVLEVYSGPPVVVFRWRHWGDMKNDYSGVNDKGDTVKIRAHGGRLEVQGLAVARVNDALKLESVDIWFDPMEMFRQIARKQKANGAENGADINALSDAMKACPFAKTARKSSPPANGTAPNE